MEIHMLVTRHLHIESSPGIRCLYGDLVSESKVAVSVSKVAVSVSKVAEREIVTYGTSYDVPYVLVG